MAEHLYLAHHGILGQKWGVRRYQNSDGTLTVAGKQRYNKLMEKADNTKNEKTAKSIRRKASKYGTETPEERDKFLKEYEELEKERLKKSKQNLEYFKNNSKDVFTRRDISKDEKRAKEAADLGLKALNKYDKNIETNEDWRDWFMVEDQTYGNLTVADMALHGKTKEEVKSLLKAADGIDYDSHYTHYTDTISGRAFDDDDVERAFELTLYYDPNDRYLDAVYEVLNEEKNNSIKHHGIKGQHWGERNYQYKDGSLTPAGRLRYLKNDISDKIKLKRSINTLNEADTSGVNDVLNSLNNKSITVPRRSSGLQQYL